MRCTKCGTVHADGIAFCPTCGAKTSRKSLPILPILLMVLTLALGLLAGYYFTADNKPSDLLPSSFAPKSGSSAQILQPGDIQGNNGFFCNGNGTRLTAKEIIQGYENHLRQTSSAGFSATLCTASVDENFDLYSILVENGSQTQETASALNIGYRGASDSNDQPGINMLSLIGYLRDPTDREIFSYAASALTSLVAPGMGSADDCFIGVFRSMFNETMLAGYSDITSNGLHYTLMQMPSGDSTMFVFTIMPQ